MRIGLVHVQAPPQFKWWLDLTKTLRSLLSIFYWVQDLHIHKLLIIYLNKVRTSLKIHAPRTISSDDIDLSKTRLCWNSTYLLRYLQMTVRLVHRQAPHTSPDEGEICASISTSQQLLTRARLVHQQTLTQHLMTRVRIVHLQAIYATFPYEDKTSASIGTSCTIFWRM